MMMEFGIGGEQAREDGNGRWSHQVCLSRVLIAKQSRAGRKCGSMPINHFGLFESAFPPPMIRLLPKVEAVPATLQPGEANAEMGVEIRKRLVARKLRGTDR
jgi:hypothetical protein